MKYSITTCTKEEAQTVSSALREFNKAVVPNMLDFNWKNLNFGLYDEQGELIGGISGWVNGWGSLYITIIWVHQDFRGQDLGTKLLEHMESEGKKLGAWKSHLETFSFQAKDFYLKNGYKIYGVLEDFPKGHNKYALFKDI